MKRILLITLLVGAMFSATAYVAVNAATSMGKNIKGSGKIVSKTIPAPDFNGIDASRAIKVIISDKVQEIRIEADDNLIDRVVVKPVKGTLNVTLDREVNGISNSNITVTVPANGKIRSLDASSASQITSEVTLRADKFRMDASSAAKIKAAVVAASCSLDASSASNIEAKVEATSCSIGASSSANIKAEITADKCSADASSAAKITLSGSADKFSADLSSASKLHASKLTAVNASIDTSSAANASIDCSGRLTASASSGSSIRYTGDCQTSLSKSSGGSIREN